MIEELNNEAPLETDSDELWSEVKQLGMCCPQNEDKTTIQGRKSFDVYFPILTNMVVECRGLDWSW